MRREKKGELLRGSAERKDGGNFNAIVIERLVTKRDEARHR